MNLHEVICGLEIFKKYYGDGDGSDYAIGAHHDEIRIRATDRPITKEDLEKLLLLGWFQSQGFGSGAENESEYDPNDDWVGFT